MANSPVKRTIPWVLLAELAMVARDHWQKLDRGDRERLTALLQRSRGLPHRNLTPQERSELMRLVKLMDLTGAGRTIALRTRASRGQRR